MTYLVGERLHVLDDAGVGESGLVALDVLEAQVEELGDDLQLGDEGNDADLVEGERHVGRG